MNLISALREMYETVNMAVAGKITSEAAVRAIKEQVDRIRIDDMITAVGWYREDLEDLLDELGYDVEEEELEALLRGKAASFLADAGEVAGWRAMEDFVSQLGWESSE